MSILSRYFEKLKAGIIKFRKILRASVIILLGIFLLVILFISPITKYLVEKYDERYTGRQITMDWAYVNPFTGYVYFNNLRIYEAAKDTLFFSAKSVSADFAMLKMLSKTYEISTITLDHPRGTIIQRGKKLNFDDLIIRFSADSPAVAKPPVHFNILGIRIEHGEFYYRERIIPIYYVMKDLNLESTGKRWDADTISAKFTFLSQNGKGEMNGDFTINVKNLDYRFATFIRNFDLEIIRQYLWELINYGMFSAQLDANVKATGNFKSPDRIDLKGRVELKDFKLGKTRKDNYAAFDKLVLAIDELSPIHQKFLFDSVTLTHPFFKYEKFDSLNNMEMLFGKNGSNISDVTSQAGRFNLIIEIGHYLRKLARNFFQSHYRINRLRVTKGDVRYSDFSLDEQFSIDANSLNIRADSVDKRNRRMNFFVDSGINPFGSFSVGISINPKDSGDFDMRYHFNKIPAAAFNPYLISYTSFPLDRGTLELNGVWNVRKGDISSVNHLVVINPQVAKRLRNKDLKWLPLPLIMAFVRERGNVIDYEIPIHGNLKNPHFRLRDVITDLLKNIFIKPATVPYGVAVKNVDNAIENTLSLKWAVRQRELRPKQKRFVEKMIRFLEKDEKAAIDVYPHEYAAKEKEYILFFEAKKKYFLLKHAMKPKAFTREDSVKVDRMSIKDPVFMRALKVGSGAGDTIMFTIQEKCNNFVGRGLVEAEYARLVKERESAFRNLFANKSIEARLKVHPSSESVPYNGFSYFKLSYPGDLPRALRKAYDEMDDLLDENPQKKYFPEKTVTRGKSNL